MTRDADFKRLVRARMAATGERYTIARAALLRDAKEAGMVPVTVQVVVQNRSGERSVVFVEQPQAEREPFVASLEDVFWSDPVRQPWLVLSEVGGARQLSIAVGPVEATAVAFAQQGIGTPRPMTHDLLRDVVAAMGTAREVRITELQDTTFLAELVVVDSAEQERAVSCRPSDGIALAVRADIPILVATELFPAPSTAAEA